jgi:TnpA family transposase
VNAQFHLWLSKFWGDGTLSSSDGQRLLTVGKNRLGAHIPHFCGLLRGLTFYTWTSNQFSQFGTKPIRPTMRDSTCVDKQQ